MPHSKRLMNHHTLTARLVIVLLSVLHSIEYVPKKTLSLQYQELFIVVSLTVALPCRQVLEILTDRRGRLSFARSVLDGSVMVDSVLAPISRLYAGSRVSTPIL